MHLIQNAKNMMHIFAIEEETNKYTIINISTSFKLITVKGSLPLIISSQTYKTQQTGVNVNDKKKRISFALNEVQIIGKQITS